MTQLFKNTKIGEIPVDWDVVKIGKITKVYAGGTPSTKVKEYWNGNIRWMKSGELNYKFIYDVKNRITKEGLKNSSTRLIPQYCTLIGLAGQGKTRGTAAYNFSELCTNQSVAAIYPCKKCISKFMYYYMDSKYNYLRQLSTGTGGRGGLNLAIIKSIPIPLPPLPEQKKIAKILTRWDKAISTLTALIAAKEVQKRGLMQQLILGEIRVDGKHNNQALQETKLGLIPRDWEIKKAGEIFKSISIKNNENEELLAATQAQGIIPKRLLDTNYTMPSGSTKSYKLVQKGNFVISLRSFQGGIEYSEYQGIISPAYTILTNKIPIDKMFFRYFFKSSEFIGRLAVAVIGIRDGKQISFQDFSAMQFRFPPLEEQTKIAKILHTADKEIDLLKAELEKIEEQKRGLMQVLLTGKMRVRV